MLLGRLWIVSALSSGTWFIVYRGGSDPGASRVWSKTPEVTRKPEFVEQ